eukprot:905204_1
MNDLFPIPNQLLAPGRRDPHVGSERGAVSDVRRAHARGEAHDHQDGVGAGVGEPDAVSELGHVGGHAGVEVGAGFGGHGAGRRGSGPGKDIHSGAGKSIHGGKLGVGRIVEGEKEERDRKST